MHNALARWIGDTRFYRFPLLRKGKTQKARTAADAVLSELGYVNVPVTIDNDDWKFNADYIAALAAGDPDAAQEIASRYIAHMKERAIHFEDLANEAFGREVKHILLLHMNQINADHLSVLLQWYADEGWRFITVQQALTDPLYEATELYSGPRGLSQIERIIGHASE